MLVPAWGLRGAHGRNVGLGGVEERESEGGVSRSCAVGAIRNIPHRDAKAAAHECHTRIECLLIARPNRPQYESGVSLITLDGELERDIFVRQLLVHLSKSIELGLNGDLVLRVQENLQKLATVHSEHGALGDNLGRVHEVLKDGFVHVGKSAAARARARDLLSASVALSENVALSNDHNMSSAELLLKLLNETGLDFVDLFQFVEGDKDHDGLTSSGNLNLLRGVDSHLVEVEFDLGGRFLF